MSTKSDVAETDEPVFALAARDKHAPALIWLWAALRELDGEDPVKVDEAREWAKQMRDWAHEHDHPVMSFEQVALASVVALLALALDIKVPAYVMHRLLAQTTFEKKDRE